MKTLKLLLILMALGCMLTIFIEQWPHLQKLGHQLSILNISVSIIAITLLFVLDAYGWHLILVGLAYSPKVIESIRIWMLSSITRYIPGGLWSYISRAEMTRQQNISLGASSLAMYMETMLLAITSLVIGFPSLALATGYDFKILEAIGLCLILSLSIHPSLLKLLHLLPGRIGETFSRVNLPSLRKLLLLYCYYLLFWIVFCSCFTGFVNLFVPLPPELWITVGSSIALSFFAGFVVIFVPGGIGVREGVLYLLLQPHMSEADALLIAVSSRIWVMMGELLSLVIVEMLYQYQAKKNA